MKFLLILAVILSSCQTKEKEPDTTITVNAHVQVDARVQVEATTKQRLFEPDLDIVAHVYKYKEIENSWPENYTQFKSWISNKKYNLRLNDIKNIKFKEKKDGVDLTLYKKDKSISELSLSNKDNLELDNIFK